MTLKNDHLSYMDLTKRLNFNIYIGLVFSLRDQGEKKSLVYEKVFSGYKKRGKRISVKSVLKYVLVGGGPLTRQVRTRDDFTLSDKRGRLRVDTTLVYWVVVRDEDPSSP